MTRTTPPHLSPREAKLPATLTLMPTHGAVVYCLPTAEVVGTLAEALTALLSPQEQVQALRFAFDDDRHAYIAAHGLLRLVLAARLGSEADQLGFEAGPWGKPALAQPQAFAAFSLSHCRSMVCVALAAAGSEVGVDVEPAHRGASGSADPEMARACFSPEECAALQAVEGTPHWAELFMRTWTLKEAVVKTSGLGMAQALHGFSVQPSAADAAVAGFVPRDAAARAQQPLYLHQWRHAAHFVAVAWRQRGHRPLDPEATSWRLIPVSAHDLRLWIDAGGRRCDAG